MAELKNDDLLLVNRNETTYTAPGEAIYGSYLTKPEIENVSLVESNPGVFPRFTDQDFVATVSMAEEGQPLSEKKFDAYVQGSLKYARRSTNPVTDVSIESSNWQKSTHDDNPNNLSFYEPKSLAFGNGKFVTVGNGLLIQHSVDGTNFTGVDCTTWITNDCPSNRYSDSHLLSVSFHSGVFIVCGSYRDASNTLQPLIVRSIDGLTWTQIPKSSIPTTSKELGVVKGANGKFISIPNSVNDIWIQTEDKGMTWQAMPGTDNLPTDLTRVQAQSLIWSDIDLENGVNGLWLTAGSNVIHKSYDNGVTWQTSDSPTNSAMLNTPVAYANGIFYLLANESADLWYSKDYTISWKRSTIPGFKPSAYNLGLANGTIYTGYGNSGYSNDVLVATSDASNWVQPIEAQIALGQLAMSFYSSAYGNGVYLACYSQSIIYATIPVESRRLTISGCLTDGFENGELLTTDPTGGGPSVAVEVTDDYLIVTNDGSWEVGQHVLGRYLMTDNVRKYLKFNRNGDVETLLDTPQSPPYLTTDEDPTLTFKFPSTFPSGFTPDEELGEGTTLTVEVTATNTLGSDGPKSDTVQPEGDPPIDWRGILGGLTTLWSGKRPTTNDIVNGIDLVNNDGLVWIKQRNVRTRNHELLDTLRGTATVLRSDEPQPSIESNGLFITSFNDDGFSLGNTPNVNDSGANYVGWTFSKTPGYFDVIKWSSDGVNGRQIPHDLGTKPGVIIVKSMDSAHDWCVYHKDVYTDTPGNHKILNLNNDSAAYDQGPAYFPEVTDTYFAVANSALTNSNTVGNGYVAYLFAEDTPDVIKCGSYIGTGAGTTVSDVGFKPQWLLVKAYEPGDDWMLFDNKRDTTPGKGTILNPNLDYEERSATQWSVTFTNTGFIFNGFANDASANGVKFIYVAIAEPPAARSLTEEELEEQKLKFLTYDNRKEVVCGEEATAVRAELLATLIEAGYDAADIAQAYSNLDN